MRVRFENLAHEELWTGELVLRPQVGDCTDLPGPLRHVTAVVLHLGARGDQPAVTALLEIVEPLEMEMFP